MADDENCLDGQLAAAIEIADAAERDAFLRHACVDDPARLVELHEMVRDYFAAGSLIERPAALPTIAHSEIVPLGEKVGAYKLRELLGEGGMGIVYVAEQETPVRRKVALKIIKPGMDSREVISRFEAERQALALMDHPNIAKIFDGGVADSPPGAAGGLGGRPYFVMELVRGLPITAHCDELKLGIRDRLSLFRQVCQAVQHAHQKGVIHRDLKPSNVIVAMHDTTPVVKVIDFGVAKAIEQQLTDHTLYTGVSQMIGTPLYMSPEQAGQSSLDVDTRSDVYSLGVLLYELLTGHTPFESETLKRAGIDEMRRMIREDEPPRPSTRVSTLQAAALSTISERRKSDPQRLSRRLRGELDWIVMKALEKDRARRYESAGSLAADIERYLTDEPVQARPPSVGYRLRKFSQRNRIVLAIVGVLLVAIVGIAGAFGWMAHARSIDRAIAGQRCGEFLVEADQFVRDGRWPDAFGIVDRANAVLGETGGSAELRDRVRDRKRELAFVLRLEEIQLEVNAVVDGPFDHQLVDELYTDAFRRFGIELDVLSPEEAVRQMPAQPIRGALVVALDGWMRSRQSQNAAWKRLLAVAQTADPDPIRSEIRDAWAQTDLPKLKRLAADADFDHLHPNTVVLLQQHLTANDAIPLLQKAQRRRRGDFWLNTTLGDRLARATPPQAMQAISYFRASVALRPNSPGSLVSLGSQLDFVGARDEAIDVYRAALRLKPDYAVGHNNLGIALKNNGSIDEAIASYREAIRLKPDYVMALSNLGSALYSRKRYAEAGMSLREAIRLDPNFAIAHANLGNVLSHTGTTDGAIEEFRNSIRLDPNNATAHNGLGGMLCDRKMDYDGAIAAFRRALEIAPDHFMYLRNLGKALSGKGEYVAAEAAFRESARRRPTDPSALLSLADMFVEIRSWDEAIAVLQEVHRLHPENAAGYYRLGDALEGKGDLDGCIAAYREALRRKPDDPAILVRFSGLQIDKGDFDGANATLSKLVRMHPGNYGAQNNYFTMYMKKTSWADAAATARILIQLKPERAEGHCNLGLALMRQGLFVEALPALRKGHELGLKQRGWKYPSATWIKECEEAAAAAAQRG
jgi:serine/threonine protein kinase/tetratricopeptide (TPR) repeat protein